ncbi:MAG: hypothetical protein P0116_12550 [Candidatus Nitrosocosmicus sp.]|nr:hypothetical protein [Candidatus Nitrosocosmicus sp.]
MKNPKRKLAHIPQNDATDPMIIDIKITLENYLITSWLKWLDRLLLPLIMLLQLKTLKR